MAISGSTTVLVDKLFYSKTYLEFYWERTAYSIEKKTATVFWHLRFYGVDGGYHSEAGGTETYEVTIDGHKYSGMGNFTLEKNESRIIDSGTITIPYNESGSEKTFSYSFKADLPGTIGDNLVTGNGTGTLDKIPVPAVLTSAQYFNDEQNPTITYNNYSGFLVDKLEGCISFLDGNEVVSYRDIPREFATTYTFKLTLEEKTLLRQQITEGFSAPVQFKLKTTIGEEEYFSIIPATFSLINYEPTLSPIVEDGNDATYALTGSRDILVRQASEAIYAFNAVGRKGAEIVEWLVTCGAQSNDSETGSFSNIETGEFIFTVVDSRGNRASKTVTKEFVDYVKPTVSANASAPTSIEEMKVTIDGLAYQGSFGKVTNTITLQYRYSAVNYPYGNWITITPTFDGNSYEAIIKIDVDDYRLGYNFQARIIDKLHTVQSVERVIKNVPLFDWGANDFNFNVPVSMQVGHINYNLYGLCRVMTQAFNFSADAIEGANYSSTSFSSSLVGNCLRCNLIATRNAATGGALYNNEKVCEVTIHHGGKIAGMLNVSFGNGNAGGVASFYTTEVSQTEETLSFSVYLASTALSETSFNTFFIIPVTLNLDKFVD